MDHSTAHEKQISILQQRHGLNLLSAGNSDLVVQRPNKEIFKKVPWFLRYVQMYNENFIFLIYLCYNHDAVFVYLVFFGGQHGT